MLDFYARLKRWVQQDHTRDTGPVHLATGLWGERIAEAAMRRKGYRTLGRRVRVGRRDEIDLVMQTGPILVFVEVRTRANEDFGPPSASIHRRKKRALSRAARHYLLRLKQRPAYYRFDVVEVIGSINDTHAPVVRHIEAALPVSATPIL